MSETGPDPEPLSCMEIIVALVIMLAVTALVICTAVHP